MLYKYLPSEYIDSVVHDGVLLFRNLSYFRKHECERRGDPLEAHHRDNPDNDIVLEFLSTGKKVQGDYSFLNSTNSDLIYAYCLSQSYSKTFYDEFTCDACIEITDVPEFLRRVRIAVRKMVLIHKLGLMHGPVSYYAANKSVELDIKDPTKLVFVEDMAFQGQAEYRLVFGIKKAFELKQSIVINKLYDFREEAMKGISKERRVKIGSIADISRVRRADT